MSTVVDLREHRRARIQWPSPIDPEARWEPEFPCGFYVAAKGRWTILARAVRHNLTAPRPAGP